MGEHRKPRPATWPRPTRAKHARPKKAAADPAIDGQGDDGQGDDGTEELSARG